MGCVSSSPSVHPSSSHSSYAQPIRVRPRQPSCNIQSAPCTVQPVSPHRVPHQDTGALTAKDPRLIHPVSNTGDEMYNALAIPMLPLSGVIFHRQGRAIGVPITLEGFHSNFYLVVEIESDLYDPHFNFRLYQEFKPNETPYWLDVVCHDGLDAETRSKCQTFVSLDNQERDVGTPKRVLGGALEVRCELGIKKKTLPFLPSNICFYMCPPPCRSPESCISIESILLAHRWAGNMTWDMCRYGSQYERKGPLDNVWVDDAAREIYVPLPDGDAFLVLGFENNRVEMKVSGSDPIRTGQGSDFGYRWSYLSHPNCKSERVVYDIPKIVSLRHLTCMPDLGFSSETHDIGRIGGDTKTVSIRTALRLDNVDRIPLDDITLDLIDFHTDTNHRITVDDAFPHFLPMIRQFTERARRPSEGQPTYDLVPHSPLATLPVWTSVCPTSHKSASHHESAPHHESASHHESAPHYEKEIETNDVKIQMISAFSPPPLDNQICEKTRQSIPVTLGDQVAPPIQVRLPSFT